jgi:hypothetical protein
MDNWKPIEPNVWKPKEAGESIIGVIVSKTPKDEQTGLSAKYQLENEQGMFLIWGSAVLDDRMQYVAARSKVRIPYNGKTKNKRNQDVNLFTVEIAENRESRKSSAVIGENSFHHSVEKPETPISIKDI